MIIEGLLTPLLSTLQWIASRIPDFSHIDPLAGQNLGGFANLMAYGFNLFPFSLFLIIIANVTFWMSAQMVWAIIEWVYEKIPGVN